MKTYTTAQVAKIIGVHPNTVRLYEKLGLIPPAPRQKNRYRVFTDRHIAQFRLARTTFQVEVLQNGLRQQMVQMVKTAATGKYDAAIEQCRCYLQMVRQEFVRAQEAASIVTALLHGDPPSSYPVLLGRRQVSQQLHISMDALRNWEMNGLLTVKRRQNGYRVYTSEDLRTLRVIRALRGANYSLEAILQLLQQLSVDPQTDVPAALDLPAQGDIVSACDHLLDSLSQAEINAQTSLQLLYEMRRRFS